MADTSDYDMTVMRERLRQAMEDAGVKAKPLALRAGLGPNAVKQILNGDSGDPKIGTLAKLAAELGVTLNYVLGTDAVPSNVHGIFSAMTPDDRVRAVQVLEALQKRA